MPEIEFKNVIQGKDKTEAEILSDGLNGIIDGQTWIASDTKRIFYKIGAGNIVSIKTDIGNYPAVDDKTYGIKNEEWVEIANSISANISGSTTYEELQALIDSGITVFYADSSNGYADISAGTYNLKANTYYFVGGYNETGFRINADQIVTLNMNESVNGVHSVKFIGDFTLKNNAQLLGTNWQRAISFEKVRIDGNSTNIGINTDSNIETVEFIVNDSTLQEVSGSGLNKYQYISGTGTLKDSSSADVTELRQENWLRPIPTNAKMTGVDNNLDYVSKVDDSNVTIVGGTGWLRKTDLSLVSVSWDAVASLSITLNSGELSWIVVKWSVGETDVEIGTLQYAPNTFDEFEKVIIIGRVWKGYDGTLSVSGRHLVLSDDPYTARDSAWALPSRNVSVEGGYSTVDVNLLRLSAGEVYRWPIVELTTKHHTWNFPEFASISKMWGHLQGQTAFDELYDDQVTPPPATLDIRKIADYWDDNGTRTALANNKFGLHLVGIYASSNIVVWIPSQKSYDSSAQARADIPTADIKLAPWASDLGQISAVVWVIAEKGTTDFSDAEFIQAEILGGGGASTALTYSHETTFGREGLNNIPIGTDFDLPFPWYSDIDAGNPKYGFDGQGGDPDRGLLATVDGAIVAIAINLESLTNDVELGIKVNGVKQAQTWTVPASTSEFSTGVLVSPIPYSAGQKIIPYLLSGVAQWGGVGIGCAVYTRGNV